MACPLGCPKKKQKSEFWNATNASGFLRLDEPPEKIQPYRPINGIVQAISSFTLKLQWGNRPKNWLGHNFWLEGPIDLRPTRPNCILQDIFRDTPLDHSCRAWICGQIWPNMPNMHIWVHIWARKIWSSGVSLKRSCKMQFRRVGLRSIGPSSQKLWPNQIFGRFPHCNYNVKLKIACRMSFMGL